MRTFYIVLLCIVSVATSFAQTTMFDSQQFLTENKTYFFNAEVEDKTLILYANQDLYAPLTLEDKDTMINKGLRSTQIDMVMVYSKYTRELWSRNKNTASMELTDTWNMNDMEIDKFASKKMKGTQYHPFFLSGNFGLSSINFESTNASLEMGAGCYLVKRVLDISFHFSFSGDMETSTATSSVGLSSRVHIPIKGARMSPFFGIGVERSSYHGDSTTVGKNTFPLYLGLSFFVGNGSIDGTYSYEKNSKGQFSIGYTFMVRNKQ